MCVVSIYINIINITYIYIYKPHIYIYAYYDLDKHLGPHVSSHLVEMSCRTGKNK